MCADSSLQTELSFVPGYLYPPGTIRNLLERSYEAILRPHPELWKQERGEWAELDRLACELRGNWLFLSLKNDSLVRMASFDPRGFPRAVIGHNCILPEHRGHGHGKQQIRELLRIMRERGFETVSVSTGDHPVFIAAQKMYISCGFVEVCRGLEPPRPFMCKEIQYQLVLDKNLGSSVSSFKK